MRKILTALLLAFALTATASAATGEPTPGLWRGTVTNGAASPAPASKVVFRVTERSGRSVLLRFRVVTTETCGDPNGTPGNSVTIGTGVSFPRITVRRDGTFRASDRSEMFLKGRFTSKTRATGTYEAAPSSLNCSGASGRFSARLTD